MIDMLPSAKLTRYNQIQHTIKQLVKQIKKQKELINHKINYSDRTKSIPLFEVSPSEIEQVTMDDISSFFGFLDDI